jgi:cobalt/nickel transport protein
MVLIALIALSSAHSLYAEFPETLRPGSEAAVWVAYGHGGAVGLPLVSLPVANLISADDEETELKLEPYQGGLKGSVPLDKPGCYILDLQMEPSFFDPAWFGSTGSKSLVERYGRALLPAESGDGSGWSRGEGLEIVPTVDPHGLKTGDQFSARALWNGKPVAGSYSAVITRLPEEVLVIQHAQETVVEGSTDDGLISFTLTEPGLWVLSFEATLDERGTWTAEEDDSQGHYRKGDKLQYEQIAPTAYLTFWVGK